MEEAQEAGFADESRRGQKKAGKKREGKRMLALGEVGACVIRHLQQMAELRFHSPLGFTFALRALAED